MDVNSQKDNQSVWLRFVKGMFIGSGFILPGVSGGALAAIFGIYERIINFLANMTKNFKENVMFFLPVVFGALAGIAILSWGVSYLLGSFETIVVWFFIGAIVGTAPSLWKEAGKHGRDKKDITVLIFSFIVGIIILGFGRQLFSESVDANFFSWMICGALIALGVLVPGMSPSNFILYMGLYEAMADGFKTLDLAVIIPIGIGGLITVLVLAKVIEKIFETHYSVFFHFIVGIVLASTLMIIPVHYTGFGFFQYFMCIIMLILGTALGWWMSTLEEEYK
ncbi:DUF368 domain-containing protein [Aerococcaceae bacterium WGS1372]